MTHKIAARRVLIRKTLMATAAAMNVTDCKKQTMTWGKARIAGECGVYRTTDRCFTRGEVAWSDPMHPCRKTETPVEAKQLSGRFADVSTDEEAKPDCEKKRRKNVDSAERLNESHTSNCKINDSSYQYELDTVSSNIFLSESVAIGMSLLNKRQEESLTLCDGTGHQLWEYP